MIGIEDARSHFFSEAGYRRLLEAVDPKVFGQFGTILVFDGLRTRMASPVLDLIGVRWLVEPPAIRLVEPLSLDDVRDARPVAPLAAFPGARRVEQSFGTSSPIRRIGISALPDRPRPTGLRLRLEEEWSGRTVWWNGDRPPDETGQRGTAWWRTTDLPATFDRGRLRLVVEPASSEARAELAAAAGPASVPAVVDGRPASAPLAIALDFGGTVRRGDLGGIDLRVFERLGAMPRWWATWEALPGGVAEVAAPAAPLDLRRTTLVEKKTLDAARQHLASGGPHRARFTLLDERPERSEVEVELASPALVVTSIKADSPHHPTIDGAPAPSFVADGLFRGWRVPAGRHRIVLEAGPFARWGAAYTPSAAKGDAAK